MKIAQTGFLDQENRFGFGKGLNIRYACLKNKRGNFSLAEVLLSDRHYEIAKQPIQTRLPSGSLVCINVYSSYGFSISLLPLFTWHCRSCCSV